MLVPVGTALGALAGAAEFLTFGKRSIAKWTVFALARKSRSLIITSRFAWSVVAGLAETSRPVETSPLIPIAGLALLPWFFLAAIRPIAKGALLSRSGSKRPIALVPITLLSK